MHPVLEHITFKRTSIVWTKKSLLIIFLFLLARVYILSLIIKNWTSQLKNNNNNLSQSTQPTHILEVSCQTYIYVWYDMSKSISCGKQRKKRTVTVTYIYIFGSLSSVVSQLTLIRSSMRKEFARISTNRMHLEAPGSDKFWTTIAPCTLGLDPIYLYGSYKKDVIFIIPHVSGSSALLIVHFHCRRWRLLIMKI